ncbi:MAG TPA: class I SAM-dependent methyltransferase [Azospirillaceae bacterium]|nr:class I SAM-dependent methyltransferase [Azospirillaceae bacterium]
MTTFYEEPLAAVHAAGFAALAKAAAAEVLSFLGDRADGAAVVDLGCGAGHTAALLCARGCRVHGLDISRDMLALARRQAPSATFRQGSAFGADIPPSRVVCAVGEVVNYLPDPSTDTVDLRTLFERVHAALEPGGLFLFDAAEPGRAGAGTQAFTEGEGWAVGARSAERDGILTRSITLFRQAGTSWRRHDEVHRLRLHPREAVLALLDAAGFEASVADGYGALRLPPHLPVYRAVR